MSVVDLRVFVSHRPDGTVVLCLDGDLDANSAPSITTWVESALAAGGTHLVLDLRDLGTVDIDGLEAVAVAHAHAQRDGGSVHLQSPTKRTVDLLLMTGLDRTLLIDETSPSSRR